MSFLIYPIAHIFGKEDREEIERLINYRKPRMYIISHKILQQSNMIVSDIVKSIISLEPKRKFYTMPDGRKVFESLDRNQRLTSNLLLITIPESGRFQGDEGGDFGSNSLIYEAETHFYNQGISWVRKDSYFDK